MISRLAARFWPSLQVGRGCLEAAAPASPSPASRALRLLPASRGRPLFSAGLPSFLHAILAPAPDALVLADAFPAALLAPAPLPLVLADG